MATERAPRLLAISDAAARGDGGFEPWLRALATSGIEAVQIREKQLDDRGLLAHARQARSRFAGRVLVNGRIDIATAAGADGVHLPSAGIPVTRLRARFGDGPIIGCSTHRIEEVEHAARAGADYATFGPVFDTPSKRRYGAPVGLEALHRATSFGLPILALGGVDASRIEAIADTGAFGVAGIRMFHDPEARAAIVEVCARVWPVPAVATE